MMRLFMANYLKTYIRTFRRGSGLSQRELGYLLGVSEDVIGNCERGYSHPPLEVILGCSVIFGKQPLDLFPSLIYAIQDGIGRRAADCDHDWSELPEGNAKSRLLSEIALRTVRNPDV